ncbi:MAG: DUF4430 domain-containing protein [Solirubrobacterales bacterium]
MPIEKRAPARRALLGALVAALAAAGLLAGCGLGAGPAPTGVQLTVTREFGAAALRQSSAPHVQGSETVMSLLMRNNAVATRFSGGFVESIDGHSGGQRSGQPSDWFYYVNGVQAPKGAAETVVHPGDRVWWDLHNWSQTQEVPAVVGSFPAPFVDGIEGKRLPVRVECAEVQSEPCRTVRSRLHALAVPDAVSTVVPGEEPDTLRVLVGAWPALALDPAALGIQRGPATSGVYARPSANGEKLTLLDANGHPTSTLGAGAGLLAATRYSQSAPVWVITGTDAAGVELAAKAFNQSTLHNRFAVALTASGTALSIPQPSP